MGKLSLVDIETIKSCSFDWWR